MYKISVFQKDKDGFTSISDLRWKDITIPIKNIFPLIRSTNPNELELLMYEKAKNNFQNIDGCVIKLIHAPKILHPLENNLKVDRNNKINLSYHERLSNIYEKFRLTNLIVPDPSSEYLFKYKEQYDEKLLTTFSEIEPIKNYIEMYRKNKSVIGEKKNFGKIRKKLYNDLWLDNKVATKKETGNMLSQIMSKEFENFGYGVPFGPVCTEEIEYFERAKQINEACQGIAYSNDYECSTMFVFTKNALKNNEIMGRYHDYIKNNNWATLNIVKFIGFDMHNLDLDARQKYFELMSDIAEIKESYSKKIFMLLEGGHQGYLSMQVFDVVSHSLTGIDEDSEGFGKYSVGNWYDEKLMITRPPHLAYKFVDRTHCGVCREITNDDFSNTVLRVKRRKHLLYDLDKRVSSLNNAVKTKTVKQHMIKVLGNSEFASFKEYLL